VGVEAEAPQQRLHAPASSGSDRRRVGIVQGM
jgi:hypothetical protein